MRAPRLRPTLLGKMLLLCNLGILLAGAFVGAILQARARSLLEAELTARGEVLAAALAESAGRGVETGNVFRSLDSLAAGAAAQRSVAHVRVYDGTGRLLASARGSGQKGHRIEVVRQVLSGTDILDQDSVLNGRRPIGQVRVGLSTTDTEAQIGTAVRFCWLAVAFLMAAGSAASGIFAIRLRASLRQMAAAAASLERGETGVRVPIVSGDELGELARTFNSMSEGLARTTVSNEYLDGILRQMADALIVTDVDGVVRKSNSAAAELLSCPETDLHGRDVASIFPLDRQAARGQSFRNMEVRVESGTAGSIPVLLSGSPMYDARGALLGLVLVAKDLRERKAMEEHMRRSDKLSALGRLAGGVAHEINNPLSVILGFAQHLVGDLRSGDPLELPLRAIEREALRCRDLVRDLLVFVRPRQPCDEEFEVSAAVEDSLRLVITQARVRGVEIKRRIDAPGLLRGDKTKIQQVIINLCSNAIDAMPKGGTVWVEAAREAEGSKVLLRVTDTGTGIPADVIPRIFEPFFSTKETGKGTGLGLAIVHEIVAQMGGEIGLRSEQDRGTSFTILLPSRGAPPDQAGGAGRPGAP